jgi:spore photoproduct lyase
MNGYLNYAPMVVQVDTNHLVQEIRADAESNPGRTFRIGSGEVGDSLLLDPLFGLNDQIIRGIADLPNVAFEMKSKTDYVDHLLATEPKGNAIVAFSLNPTAIVDAEEGFAARPEERLAAAKRCVEAGYHTAFHFDPVIRTDSFPDDYRRLISKLSDFPTGSIRWVSLGTLRFPPALRDTLSGRPYSAAEFVPSVDGKLRYLQPVRREMYQTLTAALSECTDAPVYLCMESAGMWRSVFGGVPENLDSLTGIFDGA